MSDLHQRISYSTEEVASRTGLTYRMLDYWIRCGVLQPEVAEAKGSGTYRRFSADQVEVLKRLAGIRRRAAEAGLSMTIVAVEECYRALIRGDDWILD